MNLETKDIIKQEIEHKLKATSNEIQNYLEKELTNAKEELFNQYLEIERLNNIINELEKDLKEASNCLVYNELVNGKDLINNILNDLKELKENK